MSVIKAGTTLTTAYTVEADTTGALEFKTGPSATLAMSISASGVVTFPATTGFDIASANITNLTSRSLTVSAATYLATASGNVGIGTSSPEYKLDAVGGIRIAETAAQNGYEVAPGSTNILTSYNRTTSTWLPLRQRANQHEFYCDGVETLRLTSSGNVGIATTSPLAKLDIAVSSTMGTYGPGTLNLILRNTNTAETNSGAVEFIGHSGNTTTPYPWATISAEKQTSAGDGNYAGKLHFWTTSGGANGEANSGQYRRLTINGNGNVALQGGTQTASGIGVTFPATQVASSDANCLDDYEEGTWTPTVGGNATYIAQNGYYRKIGTLVYINCYLKIDTLGTGSTNTISGLPFAANGSGSAEENVFAVSKSDNLSVSVTSITFRNNGTTVYATFRTSATVTGIVNGAFLANSTELNFSGCYISAN